MPIVDSTNPEGATSFAYCRHRPWSLSSLFRSSIIHLARACFRNCWLFGWRHWGVMGGIGEGGRQWETRTCCCRHHLWCRLVAIFMVWILSPSSMENHDWFWNHYPPTSKVHELWCLFDWVDWSTFPLVHLLSPVLVRGYNKKNNVNKIAF